MSNPNQPALDAGFTRELFASSSDYDFFLLAKPDAELDGTFRAFDTDAGEWIKINGWLFEFEDATGHVAGPCDGIMRREA